MKILIAHLVLPAKEGILVRLIFFEIPYNIVDGRDLEMDWLNKEIQRWNLSVKMR